MAELEEALELLNRDSCQPRDRSDEIHATRKKHRLGCGTINRGRRTISFRILTAYEKAFERLGFYLARRPYVFLFVSVIVVFASCLGFIRLRVEQPSAARFTATDSQSRQDLHHAAQFFPLLEARQEQIIMIPKHGQNILTEDCLKDALLVHQSIINISGYSEMCYRQLLPETQHKPVKHDCIISSPLELSGTQFESLSNLSSILAHELTNPTIVLSSGQTFNSSFQQMLSHFEVQHKTDPLTARADALRVIYFIRKTTNEDDENIVNFEASLESILSSIGRHLKCASISFKTQKSTTDALQSILKPERKPLYLSTLTLAVLVFIVIYLSSDNLSCLITVLLMISSILFPMTCSAGIISMANTSLSPTTLIIPFLLMGKATSDVVLFVVEWDRQKKVPSLEHRVSSCVTRTGFVALLSALCGTILCGIAIKSSFDVISDFFFATFVTYAIVSAASFIAAFILLMYFERWLKKLNTNCPRSSEKRLNVGRFDQGLVQYRKSKLRHILKSLTWMVTSLAGKILALFTLACIISLCVFSASRRDERTSTTESLYQNDNFKQFCEAQKKFFGDEIDTSIVLLGKIDYSQETVQNEIINICTKLKEAPYSDGKSLCWLSALRQWALDQNMSCTGTEFDQCFQVFLNQSYVAPFRRDLRFKETNSRVKILASRIHLKMALHNRFREDRGSLEKLRKDLLKQSSLEALPVSKKFFDVDDVFLLENEAVFTVFITATAVVFIFSLFFNTSFGISIYLAITFDFLVLEAAAIMEVWEIRLNQISFLSLFMTIILSLNFSIQVAHAFVFSAKQKIRIRMNEAQCSVGWSVLTAVSIMISGSVSLGFIYPSLANIFHRLVPLLLTLGLTHALFIFPAITVLWADFVHSLFSQYDMVIKPTHKEHNDRTSLEVRDGNTQQFQSKRPGISIVGISCKFPGAGSKDQFWHVLEQGKSAHGSFPKNRTEEHKAFSELYNPRRFVSGRLCTMNGSYLEEITHFDNTFFGISNQEASEMDPQQRILLQVVYEAIEDAGMRLEDLQRCRTGVFVGAMNLDYGTLATDKSNYRSMSQFTLTGGPMSILANRVSFCLNLTGPSLAVDTACSSSLTAIKIACDNLHNEDCEIAIVCAANIVLNPAMHMASCLGGLLAPDGRCKSFDSSGDGYGRGEGFAAVVLKQSNAAFSDKDDPYCDIIACGINSDGRNAVPIMAPSAKIQAELSKKVLVQSGVNPEDVDYFEAHGTGTAIADVVEVASIADTYTRRTAKSTQKLKIGSVKSNVNHTESTSGLAGLIKVALMIKKKKFVPTINIHVLNPKLKLEERGLIVQQISEPWIKANGKPRIAALNSFGYGGSNVHLIVREATPKNIFEERNVGRLNNVLTLTARSKEALQKMAELYSEWIRDNVEDTDKPFVENLCYSLNERRSQHPHRLALAFGSTAEASKSLADYADNSVGWDKLVSYAQAHSNDGKLVFMFGGQGSQWYAMGRQLIECEAVFREAVLTVSNLLTDFGMTWSLIDELMAPEDVSRMSENFFAQPATFAVQYATAQLLMSWKINPSAVIGHSLGEFAAACVSGIITIKEAVQLVLARSTLQEKCPTNGGMAALGMSEENTRELLSNLALSSTLEIAAVNDATSVTVTGESQSIEALGQYLTMHAQDTFWRVLGTKRAFHSSHMELIMPPFEAAMKRIKVNPQLSKIPMYSTVEGKVLSGEQFNGDYWWRNIRCPVQFYPAVKHLLKDGYKQIIEISTQPILAHYVKQIGLQEELLKDQEMPVVVATLPRKRVPVKDQHKCFLQNTVCKLYTLGFPIDWTCVQRSPSAKFVRSLNYPWQENSFWYREGPPETIISPLGTEKTTKKQTHPFLGQVKMTDLHSGLHCWETEIDLYHFPTLKDHALVQGGPVMPGAAYLEMAFAMAKYKFVDFAGLELSDVELSSLLTLPETQVRYLRLRLLKTNRIDEAQFHITSAQDDKSENILSSGRILVDLLQKRQPDFGNEAVSNEAGPIVNEILRNMTEMPMERFKEITEKYGFNYGPNFWIIKQIWQRDNEGVCLVDISGSPSIQKEAGDYVIHPSILDTCIQSCFVPLENSVTEDTSLVPVGFKNITLNDVPSTNQLYCHVTADATEFGVFDVTLMSPSGKVLLTMSEFRIAELTSTPRRLFFDGLAYEVQWMEDELQEQRETAPNMTCLVLKDSTDFSNALVTRLQAAKVNVITVDPPNAGCFDTKAEAAINAAFSDIPPDPSSNLRVINMWPVETTLLPDNYDAIDQAQRLAFSSSVFVLKLLTEEERFNSRLFLITERTQLLNACEKSPKASTIPWSSTVWGLRRTANLEEFNFRVTAVDLNNKRDMQEVDYLIDEILGNSIEDEVAFRDGKRLINRVVRSKISPEEPKTERVETKNISSFYLSSIPSSRTLCLRERSSSKPCHSELTVDLLYCWTPSESLIDVAKPEGCVFVVGKITDLSFESENTQLQIGDEVCGVIASGRVSPSLPIQVNNVFVKPTSLTKEQAAYIPACLAIASHALQRVATGDENQKLLIHEANRGPGPAAVVLAKAFGHRVFCTIPDTCQTSAKTLLLELGAESVVRQSSTGLKDSSVHSFDAVVYFYPPSPNVLQKSSRCLKRGGRVIILSSEFDGDVVFPSKTHVRYEREDITDILRSPLVFEKLTLESLALLEEKAVLKKLQGMQLVSVDLATSIRDANSSTDKQTSPKHQMKASSSISFLIHSFPISEEESDLHRIPVLPCGLDECGLKENKTYLVAGGVRGFGFEVACWMAENGAKSIGLISRSKPSDSKRREIQGIEKRTGTKIHTFQIDISNQEQMLYFKEQLQSLPSVAGIVHSAMVLRDAFVKDWTYQSFSDVMGPKIKGSFLLHQLSLEMDLDFFVMFSSIVSILGNMGQSSYAACNAFQDSLAQYRRKVLGLPGLSINWGPISGAGVMERESAVAKLLTIAGLGFIHAKDGVEHMAKVLTEEPSRFQIGLCGVDWPRFLKNNTGLRKTSRLSLITAEINTSETTTTSTESLVQRIMLEKDLEKRSELVMEYVSLSATEWTGMSSLSETDLNKSLYSYGVDSTAALSMKMQLEANLQVSFEVFYFMQPDTTPLKLGKDITAKLSGQASSKQPQNTNQEDGPAQAQPMADASLSAIISENQVQVVPLYTPVGSAIKFFCVHPSHRYALNLVPISTGFQGQDLVSFYALGFTDPTAVSEDWGSVRELAAHYVQLITEEQRHGPYFLGGYSYGGLLAYEMASLLTEQNKRVEFVAMIDTFPWYPRSRTVSIRLAAMQDDANSSRQHVQLYFDNVLKRMAVDTLKMDANEYKHLMEEHTQDWIIDELQKRSFEKGLASYDLRALREALQKNQSIANRTHQEWQPPKVRYRGPLTFLKSQNDRFSPRLSSSASIEELWGHLVDGGITVLVCPGDHFSLSELPNAHVTGSILATALAFNYRMLFPELPRPTRTFNQRRAVEKLCSGVNVFLHSKRGNKKPHFGELLFDEDTHKLVLRSTADEGETNENEKTKQIIDLKDLRMVQPGRLVSSAQKYAWRKRRVGAYQSGNLGQVASVITGQRVYNLEFTDYSDLKAFYNMIEAVFAVTLLTS
ncbi:mycocerosic acid synthase-like isoform X4 [Oculina patagonica]